MSSARPRCMPATTRFFTRFIYTPGFGVGRPGGLPLRAVVQASANFPGGFPLRFIRTRRFNFRAGENWIRGFRVTGHVRREHLKQCRSFRKYLHLPMVSSLTTLPTRGTWRRLRADSVCKMLSKRQREIEANWLTRNGHTDNRRTQFMPGLEKLRAIHAEKGTQSFLGERGPSYRRECRHGPSVAVDALTACLSSGNCLGLRKFTGTMLQHITSQRVRDLRHRFTGDHCGTVIDMNEWIGHPNPSRRRPPTSLGKACRKSLAPNTRLRCCMNPTDAFEQRCCL